MRMKPKLILMFVLTGIIPLLIFGVMSALIIRNSLFDAAVDKLEAVRTIKAHQIESYFSSKLSDAEVYSTNSAVVLAMERFSTAWEQGKEDGELYQKYAAMHAEKFRIYEQKYGYYDLFLISANGDVVFSVEHEGDFGQNVLNGPLAKSGLGEAFRQGRQQAAFIDFSWYNPSNTPASFISAPIRNSDNVLVGVLVYKIFVGQLNEIMHERTGMGQTGETYLLGADLLMRSDSDFDTQNRSVAASFKNNIKTDNEASRAALNGQNGTLFMTDDHGEKMVCSYAPVSLPSGVNWGMVADITEKELLAPVVRMEIIAVIVGLVLLAVIALSAYFIASTITAPLQLVQEGATRLSVGDSKLEGMDRNKMAAVVARRDELGDVGRALDDLIMYLNDKATVATEIADGNLNIEINVASGEDSVSKAMILMRDQINNLIRESGLLIQFIQNGELDKRGDAKQFKGAWAELINGMNGVVDAYDKPIKIMYEYIERISRGDIPEVIKEQFKGNFKQIIDNLNTCVNVMNELLDETGALVNKALDGDLNARGKTDKFTGSWGELIQGINQTLDAVVQPLKESQTVLDAMAQNDLSKRVNGDYKGDHAAIKKALNRSLESLNETLGQVNNSVDQVAAGAGQVSDSSQSLSQGATEQASSLEEITSSMTEIGSQTRQNAENANAANQLVSDATLSAESGNNRMKEMLDAMRAINESSNEIGRIIKVIDEIAFQTNLLALNAAVEAARAGVHGKGFAVVADEVRNLAQRSATAAKETTELIEGSTKKVDAGAAIAQETATALEEIVTSVKKVNDLIGDIAASSNEQSIGINQINDALGQVDNVTQANTTNAEESASAAEELSSQAMQLREMISRFNLSGTGTTGSAGSVRSDWGGVKNRSHTADAQRTPSSRQIVDKEVRPEDIIALDDDDFADF